MVVGESGALYLVDISGKEGPLLGKMPLCEKTWLYPALADGRFYIRDAKWFYAYEMKPRATVGAAWCRAENARGVQWSVKHAQDGRHNQ